MLSGWLIPVNARLAKILSKRCSWWKVESYSLLDFTGAVLRGTLKKNRHF
jgi:hypothetical protein